VEQEDGFMPHAYRMVLEKPTERRREAAARLTEMRDAGRPTRQESANLEMFLLTRIKASSRNDETQHCDTGKK
jgi:hypothetical protein